jgi:putative ABC transport system permease protein
LGELAVLVFVAIPVGCGVGYSLAAVLAQSAQTELFRVPLILTPRTFALSALVVLIATVVSALVVRHRVDHLDLVEVLKARE